MTTDKPSQLNLSILSINTENHISFSDEMASPNWDWHWDYLHSDEGDECSYLSNCKNFKISWSDNGGYGQYDGRINFDWYEITLYGRSPNLEGKSFILFHSEMPALKGHSLDMVKHWMTSHESQDFLANAKAMLDDAEWDYHEGDKTYKQRGWFARDELAADLFAELYKE